MSQLPRKVRRFNSQLEFCRFVRKTHGIETKAVAVVVRELAPFIVSRLLDGKQKAYVIAGFGSFRLCVAKPSNLLVMCSGRRFVMDKPRIYITFRASRSIKDMIRKHQSRNFKLLQ